MEESRKNITHEHLFPFASLVNVQKRISQGLKVLQYYTTKPWVFRNDNLLRMESMLNKEDSQKFPFNIDNVRESFGEHNNQKAKLRQRGTNQ